MIKRLLTSATLLAATTSTALAGGFLTNSNQHALFLRYPALEGRVCIEGAYYNPAGLGWLRPGWHMAVNNQSAIQTRTARSTFAPFAMGMNNGGGMTKKFKGSSNAPVIPSFDLGYVGKRVFGSFHFGVVGGGGKCTFSDGLGSFESAVSMLPGVANALMGGNVVEGYSMESYMRGRQYFFGGQLNVGIKFDSHLSASVGARVTYASSNYYGYVRNIALTTAVPLPTSAGVIPAGTSVPAGQLLSAAGLGAVSNLVGDVNLNCDQNGWGATPVVGIHYHTEHLDFGARYEFKTRIRLKNKSAISGGEMIEQLDEFKDGATVPNDVPALFGMGVEWKPGKKIRTGLSMHYYFDKDAHQYQHREHKLAGDTWELLAGVEYDICKLFSASLGGQLTNYQLGNDRRYISDMSFVTSSYSVGGGVKLRITDNVRLNLSYFKTLYYATRKKQPDYNGVGATYTSLVDGVAAAGMVTPAQAEGLKNQINMVKAGNDLFDRSNDVIGIGVTVQF